MQIYNHHDRVNISVTSLFTRIYATHCLNLNVMLPTLSTSITILQIKAEYVANIYCRYSFSDGKVQKNFPVREETDAQLWDVYGLVLYLWYVYFYSVTITILCYVYVYDIKLNTLSIFPLYKQCIPN